jgi:hypothetical protein
MLHMKTLKTLFILVCFAAVISGCKNESPFPVEKRYWTPQDYSDVAFTLNYKIPKGHPYPRFSDPETALVVQKIVDPENYKVILDDGELGLNYRNDMSQEFFNSYRELHKVYLVMDIQDKYVYPEELIAVEKWGLGLQIKYFKLGNDRIIEQSDSPEAARNSGAIKSNEQSLVKNFILYLDNVSEEKYFSSHAPLLADGITEHFFQLIETFPNANYNPMLAKAELMVKKTTVPEIKSALEKLISRIQSMKKAV